MKSGHEAINCRINNNETSNKNFATEDQKPKSVTKEIIINNKRYESYVDSGSSRSLITETIANEIGNITTCKDIELKGFAGGEFVCKEKIDTEVDIDNKKLKATLLVVKDDMLPKDILLGCDVLCQKENRIIIEEGVMRIEDIKIKTNSELSNDEGNALVSLVNKYSSCFAEKLSQLDRSKTTKMVIGLTTEKPIYQRPYRIPFAQKEAVTKIIDEEDVEGIVNTITITEKRKLAEKRISEERLKWKSRFDQKHRKPRKYLENDLVVIENVPSAIGEPRKLEPKYRGPYVIKKVLERDRYLIEDIDEQKRKQRKFSSIYASDKLKPWCSLAPELDNDSDNEEDEYYFEELESGTDSGQVGRSCQTQISNTLK